MINTYMRVQYMCYTPFILRREKNISKEFIATVDDIRETYNDAWYDTDIEHINYALQKNAI